MAEPKAGRILVTGGAGFIGSHVSRALVGRGEAVRVLDAFDDRSGDPEKKWRSVADLVRAGAIELEVGDIRDAVTLRRALRDVTRVVHLAAATGARASDGEPSHYLDVNGVGSVRVLEAAVAAGVEHVVLGSSASVYGRGLVEPAREDAVLGSPPSAYALGKRTMEMAGSWAAVRHSLRVTTVRIFSAYGPGQPAAMAVARFRAALAAGEALPVFGNGDARRSFTWVGDTARGVVAALARETAGFRVYNLAHEPSVSVLALASLLREMSGVAGAIKHLPALGADYDTPAVDVARARDELGFVATTTLADGIRRWRDEAPSA